MISVLLLFILAVTAKIRIVGQRAVQGVLDVISASTNRSIIPVPVIIVPETLARFRLLLTEETFKVVVFAKRGTSFTSKTEEIDRSYSLLLLLLIESLLHRQWVIVV